jgi:1,4-alpha-glucan branching enzyme
MPGYFALVLHAHLPFVRHAEHEKFLEESWLFEAITESYVPLWQVLDGWRRDGMETRVTLTLTPTLCAMLRDELLRERYVRHLRDLIELAEKEVLRTRFEEPFQKLASFYLERLKAIQHAYLAADGDLVGAFSKLQELGRLEIVTSAATHALLPLVASHQPSLRAQILTARDHYRECFGRDPRGIWLPECAYVPQIEEVLYEANIRWFITESHGILHADPQPRYSLFAPIFTPKGIAVFGRDRETARQVWSREEGYPGDARYRDFYRDIGYDLELDYVRPYLPAPGKRGFTGIKYHAITSRSSAKKIYSRELALRAADEHAGHFLRARVAQIERLAARMDRPPLVVSPYDAELFGHWWYEGPEFLDYFVRKAYYDQQSFTLITPSVYLHRHPTNQVATPAPSSWGEAGYWRVWLNEKTEWIHRHLHGAQDRMTELARRFARPSRSQERALKQAVRELLLAQASDWPFILHTGTSPGYARRRVKTHLVNFNRLYEQLTGAGVDEIWLAQIESSDNIFPGVNLNYWARGA